MSVEYWLQVEATGFASTVVDTDDLSTIRGASWALLEFPNHLHSLLECRKDIKATTVACGGSGGIWLITTSLDAGELSRHVENCLALKGTKTPFNDFVKAQPKLAAIVPYLSFSFGLVAAGVAADLSSALPLLQRAKALNQYRSLDLDIPPRTGSNDDGILGMYPCSKDRTRPAAAWTWRSAPDGGKPLQDVPVSLSVEARRNFGMTGRRAEFYQAHADLPPGFLAGFSDSFEEIATSGTGKPLPNGIEGRMAIVSLDGNGFGSLKREFSSKAGEAGIASYAVQIEKTRKHLLGTLITKLAEHEQFLLRNPQKQFLLRDSGDKKPVQRKLPVLRFETLLWGADEGLFVLPAWGLPQFLDVLHGALGSGHSCVTLPDGAAPRRLTYGLGILMCHYKTPIRMARKLADDLRDEAKREWARQVKEHGKDENLFSLMVLDGMEVPTLSVSADRHLRYAVPVDEQGESFVIPLTGATAMFKAFAELKGEPGARESGVARAKIAEALQAAIRNRSAGSQITHSPDMTMLLDNAYRGAVKADGSKLDASYLDEQCPWWNGRGFAPLIPLLELWNLLPGHDDLKKLAVSS